MIDKDTDNEKCELISWNVKTLEKEFIPETEGLPPKSTLKVMKFVGKESCCILQIIKQTNDEAAKKNKEFFLTYRIFDAKTGKKLLDWSNNKQKSLRVLCLLINAKVSKTLRKEMRKRGE